MKVVLGFDYELFFHHSGSLEKCILEPTEKLINIAHKHGVKFCFFVDAGYLKALREKAEKFDELNRDYLKVTTQIKELHQRGHEIALHIHPHWEDTEYSTDKGWEFDVSRYRLHHFSEVEVSRIISSYHHELESLIQDKITVFRAGGWCVQPFHKIRDGLKSVGIQIDSSCYRGGYLKNDTYFIDYTDLPNKDSYHFNDDVCVEDASGDFKEVPISSTYYSAFFFWRLYVLGRLFPKKHKPMGDGNPVPVSGYRKKVLLKGNTQCVSVDGYFASVLKLNAKNMKKAGREVLNIIGHPKACTNYSLKQLVYFIAWAKRDNQFYTFKDL